MCNLARRRGESNSKERQPQCMGIENILNSRRQRPRADGNLQRKAIIETRNLNTLPSIPLPRPKSKMPSFWENDPRKTTKGQKNKIMFRCQDESVLNFELPERERGDARHGKEEFPKLFVNLQRGQPALAVVILFVHVNISTLERKGQGNTRLGSFVGGRSKGQIFCYILKDPPLHPLLLPFVFLPTLSRGIVPSSSLFLLCCNDQEDCTYGGG